VGLLIPSLGLSATAIAVALGVRLLVDVYVIRSESMKPTLLVGDRVLVARFLFYRSMPKRGDVVVIAAPHDAEPASRVRRRVNQAGTGLRHLATGRRHRRELIKRVVAVEGDMVGLGTIAATADTQRWVVPPESIFIVGDNQAVSRDSRSFGPVEVSEVVGRALLVVWPPARIRFIAGREVPPLLGRP
jgi:signal peptidase I